MLKILLAAVLLAVLLLGGRLLYRHFVTDRIADKGGMENPYVSEMVDDDTDPALHQLEGSNA